MCAVLNFTPTTKELSPTYPRPIEPYVKAGFYRLPGTNKEINIPDLYGMSTELDMVAWDRLSGIAWVNKLLKYDMLVAGNTWALSDAMINSPYLCTHLPQGNLSGQSLTGEIQENFYILYQLATPTRTPLTITENLSSTAPYLPMEALSVDLSPNYPQYWYDKGENNVLIKDQFGVTQQTIPIPKLAEDEIYNTDSEVMDGLWIDLLLLDLAWDRVTDFVEVVGYKTFICSTLPEPLDSSMSGYCSHFTVGSTPIYNAPYCCIYYTPTGAINITIQDSLTGITSTDSNAQMVTKFVAWMTAESTAGRPVKVRYRRATPLSTPQTPIIVRTHYPETIIRQDGNDEIQSEITATYKVIDLEA